MAISSDFMINYGILWGFVLWDSVGICPDRFTGISGVSVYQLALRAVCN